LTNGENSCHSGTVCGGPWNGVKEIMSERLFCTVFDAEIKVKYDPRDREIAEDSGIGE